MTNDVDRQPESRNLKDRLRGVAGSLRSVPTRVREIPLQRLLGHLFLLALIALGGWIARLGLTSGGSSAAPQEESAPSPTSTPVIGIGDLLGFAGGGLQSSEISRLINGHTVIPSRPRIDILKYEVQSGDSLFGIAGNFGLKPETILWGNYDALQDNPHNILPGQELNIPPVDGTLHSFKEGESLTGIADFYEVSVRDIIDWPGNHLSPDIDLEDPPIEPGTLLMVPGGSRDLVDWAMPRIPRSNPSVASIYGPGACGTVYDGPIGLGSFVWPTSSHYISGYHYIPGIHEAIDIGGAIGNGIFASDSGVVVYSGWNTTGYGNVIVLDHGNGWQTLYAHLSDTLVGCGEGVFQGAMIGLMGVTGNSTGPHLHFEMLSDVYGRVNPLNFLP